MVMFLFVIQDTPGLSEKPSEKPFDSPVASRLTPDGRLEVNYTEENSTAHHGGLFESTGLLWSGSVFGAAEIIILFYPVGLKKARIDDTVFWLIASS